MARVPALVDAGVTDLLAGLRPPPGYDDALAAYSELVQAFRTATDA
jgi:hypothetical protein